MRANATAHGDDDAFRTGLRRNGDARVAVRARLVGVSPWVRDAVDTVARLADASGPVLLVGERGVGKRFLARLMHEAGPRAHRPFVVLEASMLDEAVLTSVLFDAREGASAASRELRREYAERVRGGTLYVADVATLSPEVRRRIARAVAHPELEHARLRAQPSRAARVVFGASDAGIETVDCDGVLRIPALRDRRDDVLPLAEHFAADACRRLGKESRELSHGVRSELVGRMWPANVAELKTVVEQMVRRAGPPVLDVSLLRPGETSRLEEGFSLHDAVEQYERTLLRAALERCGGVQTKAAMLLGLKVSTLNSKLSSYDIDARAFKASRPA